MNVILLHGKNADPSSKWYPWFAAAMKERGIECHIPVLPQADNPDIAAWKEEIDELHPNKDTVLIGHSRGGVAVLRWLEDQPTNLYIKKVILVATNSGFLHRRAIPTEINHGFYTENGYDFAKIRSHCDDFVVIHSKNDQWVPYDNGEENAAGLHAKFLSFEHKGHFGKGVDQVPELVKEVV